MMKCLQTALLLTFLLFGFMFFLMAQTEEASETIEIRLDPTSAEVGASSSDYFSSIKYVPLQANDESMFNQISQMEVTSKYYIIWDETINAILVFDKDGAFRKKISSADKTLTIPFKKIDHFAVDELSGELFFDDSHSDLVFYYSLEGNFLRAIKKASYFGKFYAKIGSKMAYCTAYDFSIIRSAGFSPKNLILDNGKGEISSYVSFDTTGLNYTDLYSVDQAFYNNHRSKFYFSLPYNYTVFTIDLAGKVDPKYRFVLPAFNAIPEDFLTNSAFFGKRMAYTRENPEVIYAITDFYEVRNRCVFRLFGHNINKVYSYNTVSGSFFSISDMLPDQLSYMLPFFEQRIYAIDELGNLLSYVPATLLIDSANKIDKSSSNLYPPILKDFFNSREMQNPVLTILSIRDD